MSASSSPSSSSSSDVAAAAEWHAQLGDERVLGEALRDDVRAKRLETFVRTSSRTQLRKRNAGGDTALLHVVRSVDEKDRAAVERAWQIIDACLAVDVALGSTANSLSGHTPLAIAAARSLPVLVFRLCEAGIAVDIPGSPRPLLHLAVSFRNATLLDIVLCYAEDLEATDRFGRTARRMADEYATDEKDKCRQALEEPADARNRLFVECVMNEKELWPSASDVRGMARTKLVLADDVIDTMRPQLEEEARRKAASAQPGAGAGQPALAAAGARRVSTTTSDSGSDVSVASAAAAETQATAAAAPGGIRSLNDLVRAEQATRRADETEDGKWYHDRLLVGLAIGVSLLVFFIAVFVGVTVG